MGMEEVRKAFAEAFKYAKIITVDDVHSKTIHIVAGDSPEDTDRRVQELVKKSFAKGCSVTFPDGNTQWIEDQVVMDFSKVGAACYKWDKHGNKVLCERTLYTRAPDGVTVTSKVLKKVYKDYLKIGD